MERPRTVHEAGGFVNNAAKLVHTCGLSPLQDSHSNTDSCADTMGKGSESESELFETCSA